MQQEARRPASIALENAPAFLSAMELAQVNGDTKFLDLCMPLLTDLLERIQKEVHSLSQLQLRGCLIREAHQTSETATAHR